QFAAIFWPCLEEEAHSTHLQLRVNGQIKVIYLPTILKIRRAYYLRKWRGRSFIDKRLSEGGIY
ncbi:MAG: hypothetical protein RPR40_00850, partial [Bermanella sp.]